MLLFNDEGLLEPDDYSITISDLKTSLLVHGPGQDYPWDDKKRLQLVNNLEILVDQLWTVGIDEIYIDGSFVEDKASPSDIDGYFIADLQSLPEIVRELNKMFPAAFRKTRDTFKPKGILKIIK